MMISLRTFCSLIRRDIAIFKSTYFSQLIDCMIVITFNITIFHYIMPLMGVVSGYGALMVAGCFATNALFDIIGNSAILIGDITGDRTIDYDLTLPLPHILVIFRLAISNALKSMSVFVWLLPVSKLIMGNALTFQHASWSKVIALFLLAHIFYGFCAIFITSCLQNLWGIRSIWIRFIFPFWSIGGYSFTWKAMHSVSPVCAYINLLNPLTMCFEGMRGALLGQEDYLPFWGCFFVLLVWTIIIGSIGTKRMLKKLDCVY